MSFPLERISAIYSKRRLLHGGMIFVGYLLATQLSYLFYVAPAVFPIQSGVALAGLVLGGIALWPAIFISAIVGYILSANSTSIFIPVMLAIGNTLQAVTGAYILEQVGFNSLLHRMHAIFSLLFVALTTSTIVPLVGSLGYLLREFAGGTGLPIPWAAWWVGHILSLLIVSPFLIRWIAEPYIYRTKKELLEIAGAFSLLLLFTSLAFIFHVGQSGGVPLVYLILIPLFWISLRLGPRLTTLALFLMSIMALGGAVFGSPVAPPNAPLGHQLFLTEIFIEVLGVIFLIIAAISAERKFAKESLESHIKQLEEALAKIRSEDQAKSDFVATLAHELRNPLAPLLSSLELLAFEGPDTPDFSKLLTMMRGRVATMTHLLDDLLDIARVSRQKLHLNMSSVDMLPIVTSAVESIKPLMQSRNHTLEVTVPPNEKLVVQGDPIRLEQVLVNLLNNAVKYTEPGGRITLTIHREGASIVVQVADTGIGIPAHMMSRIFDPFQQAHTADSIQMQNPSGTDGLGIGLALTKRLVDLHKGTIEVHSDGKGKGSSFMVKLPAFTTVHAPKVLPEHVQPASTQPVTSKLRILVVDDNEEATKTLSKLLAVKGHAVESAFNAATALKVYSTFNPEVIILDIGLPDINGYDLAQKLRNDCKYTSLLITITGFGQLRDIEHSLDAGFDYHLTKPVSIAQLETILTKAPQPHISTT